MASDDVARIELLLREHFAQTDKQISDMKAIAAQMKADNAEFHAQMMKEQREFEARIEARIDAFEAKQEARFNAFEARQEARDARQDAKIDALTTAVVELQRDVEGLKHDVQGLYHWDYWLLSIILVIFAMPQIVAGVKSLFVAVTEGIAGIISLFRHK